MCSISLVIGLHARWRAAPVRSMYDRVRLSLWQSDVHQKVSEGAAWRQPAQGLSYPDSGASIVPLGDRCPSCEPGWCGDGAVAAPPLQCPRLLSWLQRVTSEQTVSLDAGKSFQHQTLDVPISTCGVVKAGVVKAGWSGCAQLSKSRSTSQGRRPLRRW